jgi:MTH538 TIR-like domain (DUF1863)
MARRVFFSFHYERDVRRVAQVRSSWAVRSKGEAQPFYDKADWEKVRSQGIEKWIESQLAGTSVLVVLIGAETSGRDWVRYEIKRAYQLGKGIVGVFIHNVKDPISGTDHKGENPLDRWSVERDGRKVLFSSLYRSYDWQQDDGYSNLASWVEAAAAAAGR